MKQKCSLYITALLSLVSQSVTKLCRNFGAKANCEIFGRSVNLNLKYGRSNLNFFYCSSLQLPLSQQVLEWLLLATTVKIFWKGLTRFNALQSKRIFGSQEMSKVATSKLRNIVQKYYFWRTAFEAACARSVSILYNALRTVDVVSIHHYTFNHYTVKAAKHLGLNYMMGLSHVPRKVTDIIR